MAGEFLMVMVAVAFGMLLADFLGVFLNAVLDRFDE